ncbi:hypothetical protein JCM10908_003660 [Rhodotorula pacifica]|uniref:uncharacterized protein n=1 Tax=Rhodotorula pacifica TaxID=1495444 RepID=UPI003173B86B
MSADSKGLGILLAASSVKEDEEKIVHATQPAVSPVTADEPTSVVLPPELLDEILRPQFASTSDLRGRVRLATTLGLVCKVFKLRAEAIAWEDVQLDVSDLDALAYLDPNGGPGRRVLLYIQTLYVRSSYYTFSSNAFSTGASDNGSTTATGFIPDNASLRAEAAVERGPFSPKAVMGMSREERHARVVACSASIIASCSNILELCSLGTAAPILARVCSEHELQDTWPRLLKLDIDWIDPMQPPLAGDTVHDLITRYPTKSMTSLERVALYATPGYSAHHPFILPLLAANARLNDASWTGAVPPGFCAKLTGCTRIEFWHMPHGDFAGTLLPQLHDLQHAPVDALIIRPSASPSNERDTDTATPSVQALFDSIPYSVKVTAVVGDSMGGGVSFPQDTAMSAAMQRPLATVQAPRDRLRFFGAYQNKPLIQVVYIRVIGYDDLWYFGRFGDPDKNGDVTDWLPLNGKYVESA